MKRFSILLTLFVGATIGYIAACSNTKPEGDANAAADVDGGNDTAPSHSKTANSQLSAGSEDAA